MTDFMNVYPVRNCNHELNSGLVTILFIKKKLNIIERIFFKKISSKPYKIDLDEIGSFVWNLCDGNKTVKEITEISKRNFGERIEPAEERVEKFIRQMNKNKLVSLYERKSN
jgi:hypothetical protein